MAGALEEDSWRNQVELPLKCSDWKHLSGTDKGTVWNCHFHALAGSIGAQLLKEPGGAAITILTQEYWSRTAEGTRWHCLHDAVVGKTGAGLLKEQVGAVFTKLSLEH